MPSVTINDEVFEAKIGERLLDVARRNGAHIGFVCDGNGICQTCQCQVLSGRKHLSPPNAAERDWMTEARLNQGHRLSCQTAIRGPGPIVILTAAEQLRRNVQRLVQNDDRPLIDRMEPLLEQVVSGSIDQLARYPFNMLSTMARVGVGRFFWPVKDGERWLDDAQLVAQRMNTRSIKAEEQKNLKTRPSE